MVNYSISIIHRGHIDIAVVAVSIKAVSSPLSTPDNTRCTRALYKAPKAPAEGQARSF